MRPSVGLPPGADPIGIDPVIRRPRTQKPHRRLAILELCRKARLRAQPVIDAGGRKPLLRQPRRFISILVPAPPGASMRSR